jgi:hypothetical protein
VHAAATNNYVCRSKAHGARELPGMLDRSLFPSYLPKRLSAERVFGRTWRVPATSMANASWGRFGQSAFLPIGLSTESVFLVTTAILFPVCCEGFLLVGILYIDAVDGFPVTVFTLLLCTLDAGG